MNKFSSIKKIDENTFQINEYDICCYKFGIKLKYSSIILGVIICIVVANIWNSYKHNNGEIEFVHNIINEPVKNSTAVERNLSFPEEGTVTKSTGNEHNSPFTEDGFILPNSSNCYLSEEDLNFLDNIAEKTGYSYSLLCRFAINEIYARNGYFFKTQEFNEFYSTYQWYKDLYKVEEVPWGELNEYERYNLTLLLSEENK